MATKPYKAFMLTPSYRLRQVTVIGPAYCAGYLKLETGPMLHHTKLFTTKKAAIAAGKKVLEERRERLAKSQSNIEKHAANLAGEEGG